MQKLTNCIQSGLIESENPLVELYRYLRMRRRPMLSVPLISFSLDYYCQSLRLQILFEQVGRAKNETDLILRL